MWKLELNKRSWSVVRFYCDFDIYMRPLILVSVCSSLNNVLISVDWCRFDSNTSSSTGCSSIVYECVPVQCDSSWAQHWATVCLNQCWNPPTDWVSYSLNLVTRLEVSVCLAQKIKTEKPAATSLFLLDKQTVCRSKSCFLSSLTRWKDTSPSHSLSLALSTPKSALSFFVSPVPLVPGGAQTGVCATAVVSWVVGPVCDRIEAMSQCNVCSSDKYTVAVVHGP